MLSLPWEVVTRLKLEPVGPIRAQVFGLRYVEFVPEPDCESYPDSASYDVAEPSRLKQFRDALGGGVDSPTGLRRPEKTPWFTALCNVQLALTEEGK